jgi:hypothetical protein
MVRIAADVRVTRSRLWEGNVHSVASKRGVVFVIEFSRSGNRSLSD